MSAPISEQNLPGIGRSYTLTLHDGSTVVVVLHHSGRRDLYVTPPSGKRATCVSLADEEARQLGSVLSGAYFKPAIVERVEALIGGLLIDWVTIKPSSPAVDRTIADLEVRRESGMTIAAIAREDGTSVVAPEPDAMLRAGDQLVVVGRPEDLPRFVAHVIG
jgi:TrkA domain protein